jgi:Transglutaminase-like superfamily
MGRLLKFWSLTRREKLFLFEACILLLLSNLSVKTVAFRHIDSYLRTHWNDHPRAGIDRPDHIKNDIKLVNLSFSRAAYVFPWKSLCLSRSIAEFVMLRRRGIPAVLLAGVKSLKDSSLHAHAWIHAGDGVVDWNSDGSSDNSSFTVVLRVGHESLLDSSRNVA